ncbi:Fc receptor-like protein 5 isoform X2 [Paramormyrops kingsleyae]|uniref:Fc receptor-like protein 5 isoform X2 n=1 Tax=Paramormyrops kingsleyae TaxID=1676925 RepID=UPI003B97C18B
MHVHAQISTYRQQRTRLKEDTNMQPLVIKIVLIILLYSAPEEGAYPGISVTIDPPWSDVAAGETVTLTCRVTGSDPDTDWKYSWIKESSTEKVRLFSYSGSDFSTYTLHNPIKADSAQYWCTAMTNTLTISSVPHTVRITESPALPQARLVLLSGWTDIFSTESLTLRCELHGDSTQWQYTWYRDGQVISVHKETYTILSVTLADSGRYFCAGQYARRRLWSQTSNEFAIRVSALPKALLTLESNWTEIFTTESVTLRCGLQGDSAEWEYKWYRDQKEIQRYETGHKYRILSVTRSDTGQYTCRGQYRRRRVLSEMSNDISITVSALPKAVLTVESGWTEIFITENVTLRCGLQGDSAEWEYKWYKNNQEILKSGAGHQHTILSANPSDTGGYACRGQYRRRTHVSSEMSSTLQINVTALPKAVLTLESNWTEIFTTESVTLRCGLQGDSAEGEYKWYKDQQEIHRYEAGDKYRILSVTRSDTGQYTCRGQYRRRRVLSEMSNDISITVSALPKAVLTVESGWTEIFITENVTLRCDLQGDSAEWEYKWYRDGQEIPPYGPGDKYTITKATLSDSGGYTCRGQYRGRRRVLCEMSNDLPIKISVRPQAVLQVETEWIESLFTENLVLRCEVPESSAEWSYTWYRDGQPIAGYTGDRYTVMSGTGVYTCRGVMKKGPSVSWISEGLTAGNILLKRKVLVFVTGCIILCLIAIILGSLCLRLRHKPGSQCISSQYQETTGTRNGYSDNSDTLSRFCCRKI